MTARKPEVTEVFDLDAARAQRFEAGKPNAFTFKYDGGTYNLPVDLKASTLRKLREVDEDDFEAVFSIMLGQDQAKAFFNSDPSLGDLADLMEAYQKAVGVTLGKDSGSKS